MGKSPPTTATTATTATTTTATEHRSARSVLWQPDPLKHFITAVKGPVKGNRRFERPTG